jgi:LacI family transcriptional regulator
MAFVDKITAEQLNVYVYEEPYAQAQGAWKKELPALAKWLKSLPKPVGIMACSDKRAQHVLEACYIAKLHVPEDVAVLGVDNDDFFCELSYRPLSSISINTESIGYQVGEILDRSVNGEKVPPQELLFEPIEIVERESTEVLAIDDEQVKGAVRFIRLNRMKHISATEVAEAVGTCIRTLDRRFKKSLGRPVHSEIVRVRIEQACHMLSNSNLSVAEIAYKLGYFEPKHLTQAFKREKGMSPVTYRNSFSKV